MSFETTFAFSQITRLNTVLLRPIPIWEFSDIISCLEFSRNSRTKDENIIPRLSEKPRKLKHKESDYFTTAPFIWIKQFNRLPPSVKCFLGTKKFATKLRYFFMSICPHNEFHDEICGACGRNCRDNRQIGYMHIKVENLRSKEYCIESTDSIISRQMIIESNIGSNFFYNAISRKTNWFNSEVSISRGNFFLTGPILG